MSAEDQSVAQAPVANAATRGQTSGLRSTVALVGFIWVVQLVVGLVSGRLVSSSVASVMGRFAILDDGHELGAFFELLAEHPDVGALLLTILMLNGVIALLLWVMLAGGVLGHLRGTRGAGAFVDGARSAAPDIGA